MICLLNGTDKHSYLIKTYLDCLDINMEHPHAHRSLNLIFWFFLIAILYMSFKSNLIFKFLSRIKYTYPNYSQIVYRTCSPVSYSVVCLKIEFFSIWPLAALLTKKPSVRSLENILIWPQVTFRHRSWWLYFVLLWRCVVILWTMH